MEADHQPKGTLVILVFYLALTILSWLGVYLLMLQRGGV